MAVPSAPAEPSVPSGSSAAYDFTTPGAPVVPARHARGEDPGGPCREASDSAGLPEAPEAPEARDASSGGRADGRCDVRARITELRLSAFAGHRRAVFPLGAVTLFAGPSGAGKSTAFAAFEALARLGGGMPLVEVFPDPVAWIPERARPDAGGGADSGSAVRPTGSRGRYDSTSPYRPSRTCGSWASG